MMHIIFSSLLLLLLTPACGGPPHHPLRPGGADTASRPNALFEQGQGTFTGHGGIQLFEQWWRPKGNARGAVILVHGLKDHSSRYAGLAHALATDGIAVYAFDLRGHAHSAGERVYIDRFTDYVEDLKLFRARVEAREKGARLFLFGHSMGGTIVTLSALEQPSGLAGLIVQGGALRVDAGWPKILGTRLVAALAPRAGVFQLDLEDFSRSPDAVRQVQNDPWVFHPAAPARTAAQLLAAMRTIEQRSDELSLPLFVLHGEADEVTSPQGSRDLFARASSKDKQLKLYPRLVHDLLHEPEKDLVINDIRQWVSAHTSQMRPTTPESAGQSIR